MNRNPGDPQTLMEVFIKLSTDEKLSIRVLFTVWLVVQLSAYLAFGISTPIDSELYIGNANLILSGSWPQGYELLYVTYSLLLAIPLSVGLEPTAIVLLQISVAGAALFSLHQIAKITSGNNRVAFMAALLYVLWFKFQQWNLIVYTDSLFANMAIVCVYLLLIAKKWHHFLFACLLIVLTSLLRPVGIGFIIAIAGYILYHQLNKRTSNRFFQVTTWLVFISVILILINEVLRDSIELLLQSYANAEIIYPKISMGIGSPKQLYLPDGHHQPLVRLGIFILSNPLYMFKITTVKALLFLAHVKPYYSFLHNAFIVCFLLPVYFFAIRGVRHILENKMRVLLFVFIGFQVVTVSLTSENWDGRFLLPVLPWVFIVSALGISAFRIERPGEIKP